MADERPREPDGPLLVYLKGFCMGSADAVPGVSGGTIALIVGIYRRLIDAVAGVTPGHVGRALGALAGRRWTEAREIFEAVDGWFLLALGGGVLTAVVVVTRVLAAALASVPVLTFGLFFGLIAASAVVLARGVRFDGRARGAAAVAGFLATFLVSGNAEAVLGTSLPVTALAGAVAVSAMLLPGLSGSLLLIVLGQYEHMVTSLKAFVDGLIALATTGAPPGFADSAATVVAFLGGAVVGLFTVAHLVRRALRTHPETTMAFLVAMVVGALRAPVVEAGSALDAGWTSGAVAAFLGAALVGAALVAVLERYATDIAPPT